MKKLNIYLLLMVSVFSVVNVKAAPNVKTEDSTDANTKENKCPYSIIVQDNLSGSKDMDFSDLDCMFYKTNENGEKVLREETDNIDFSCLQSFLEKYTNEEFAEATDNRIAEGFPTNNKYCPVYCVEANEFVFPGFAPQINSGGHFTWTVEKDEDKNILDGLTVRLQGSKICRAQVDLEQWIDDYEQLMKDIQDSVKTTRPTSSGNSACTPNADKVSVENGECGFSSSPVKTTKVIMTAGEYNELYENYESGKIYEMENLTQDNAVDGTKFFMSVDGLLPTPEGTTSVDDALAEGDSNRWAFSFAFNDKSDNTVGIHSSKINTIASYRNGELIVFDRTGHDVYHNGNTLYREFTINTWERSCCQYVNPQEQNWVAAPLSPEIESLNQIIENSSFGYYLEESGNYCGNPDHGGRQESCCGYSVTETGVKYCSSYPRTYYKYTKYDVVCAVNGSGNIQNDSASGPKQQCTYGSTATCPSGYQYSSVKGTCMKADISRIVNSIRKMASLRLQLKQCKDQLIDYDYYLDTDMEIEYNETSDSINNKYFPNKDAAIDTKLIRVDRNTDIDDGENILGEYSSEIVNPSQKSDMSSSISFFGETYTIDKNGIPIVACTLSGSTKLCSAVNSTEYSEYWYDWFGRAYIAMYEYKLVDNFYRWVKIPSGESVSTKPTGDYLKYNRYIEIGYPNYPVHFATPAGDYEGLNVRIKNVGYKNYLYNEYQGAIREYNGSLSDRDLTSTEQNNELLHDCYYHVTEGEPYCPTVGCDEDEFDLGSVRIIYRPISLENPFPARDGDGRDTGSNWCIINNEDKTSDCSNENENVDKYILNNRNVVGSEVYNKEPMYQITLNPALIKQIREYNKGTDYDDYNLYCSGKDGEEGTECRSHFVVGGMEETSLPTLSSYFEDTCGMSSDWDACDKLDGIER